MDTEGTGLYRKEDADRYTRMRWWLGLTLSDLLDRAADLFPGKEALVDGTSRMTYAQLRDKVNRLAVGLMGLGIRPGDRVLLQLPNWSEFISSYFACQKIGVVVVLVLHRHALVEVNHLAALTQAKAWIVPERYRKTDYIPLVRKVLETNPELEHVILVRAEEDREYLRLEELVERSECAGDRLRELEELRPDPMGIAQMLPTGGTTGLPKIALRTHNDFICSVEYKSYAWKRGYDDICLVMAPPAHGASLQVGILSTFFTFGKLVLLDSPRAEEICGAVQREGVTCAQLVPALLQRIIGFEGLKGYDLSSLRKIHVGAAYSPPQLLKEALKVLDVQIVSAYGSVEGTHCNTRPGDDPDTLFHTVGRPCCPHDRMKVIDQDENELPPGEEGELVAKGPSVFGGYLGYDNSKAFTKDGFFKTGDRAVIDRHGNVRITGRIKEIIIRGGENINPGVIEELIMRHPDVEAVAVVGMPDQELGERICAYIQPKSNKKPTFQEIVSFLRREGASVLLLPERVEFVDVIPLTSANKPDKKVLREDIKQRMSRGR